MKDGCEPLKKDNVMVISTGLLSGTLSSPCSYSYIITKSPLTGLIEKTYIRGLFASKMKWAGFDHIIIKGKSNLPVFLYIHNGDISIKKDKNVRSILFNNKKIYRKKMINYWL